MIEPSTVILITGPSGSGKSTLARKICSDLHYADIDIETVNYMIPDGFEEKSDGTLDFSKWDLSAKTAAQLVLNFKNQGYGAIIHGHVTKGFIKSLEKRVGLSLKVLILPSLDTVIKRDGERPSNLSMGRAMVTEHYKYFESGLFDDFTTIDSTSLTINQTVDRLKELLAK